MGKLKRINPRSFLNLTDIPTTYSGAAGKVISVSADESGLEFVTMSGSSGVSDHGNLTGLSDDDHPQYVKIVGDKVIEGQTTFSGSVIINTTTVEQSAILDLTDYDVETDEGTTYHYIGRAPSGTATSAASWRVARITITTEAVLWADGNRNFDNIWNNRASLSYS